MVADSNEPHSMRFVSNEIGGYSRWSCDICNRLLLIRAKPFHKIVIVKGNEHVTHLSGTTGQTLQQQMGHTSADGEWLSKIGIKWE